MRVARRHRRSGWESALVIEQVAVIGGAEERLVKPQCRVLADGKQQVGQLPMGGVE